MNKREREQYAKQYESLKAKLKFFLPEDNPQTVALIKDAWITNLYRDDTERKAGFAASSDTPLDAQLRTVINALLAGLADIERGSLDGAKSCVAEAAAMTQLIEALIRKALGNNGE